MLEISTYFSLSCFYFFLHLFYLEEFFHKARAWPLQPNLSNSSAKTASFPSCSFVRARKFSDWAGLSHVPMGVMGKLARLRLVNLSFTLKSTENLMSIMDLYRKISKHK